VVRFRVLVLLFVRRGTSRRLKVSNTSTGSAVWRNLFSGKSILDGTTEAVLSKVPAFAELSARDLRRVAAIVHKREYKSGEPVFYQGDPGLGMFIIQEGEISIRISEREGDDKELALLTDGDFFGELALLDESPRSATALCKTDCSVIGFFRTDLMELIKENPDLGMKIVMKFAEILAHRLRKTDKDLSKLQSQLDRLVSRSEKGVPISLEDHDGNNTPTQTGSGAQKANPQRSA
jgi:CRP/FNR family transcriptional regulator, cyclic AMP receptor protein